MSGKGKYDEWIHTSGYVYDNRRFALEIFFSLKQLLPIKSLTNFQVLLLRLYYTLNCECEHNPFKTRSVKMCIKHRDTSSTIIIWRHPYLYNGFHFHIPLVRLSPQLAQLAAAKQSFRQRMFTARNRIARDWTLGMLPAKNEFEHHWATTLPSLLVTKGTGWNTARSFPSSPPCFQVTALCTRTGVGMSSPNGFFPHAKLQFSEDLICTCFVNCVCSEAAELRLLLSNGSWIEEKTLQRGVFLSSGGWRGVWAAPGVISEEGDKNMS